MLTLNFIPFPNLETDRLSLRRVTNDDVTEIFDLRSNKELMKYIPRPLAKNTNDALEHIAMIDEKIDANLAIHWAISLKYDTKLIGIIGHFNLQPEHLKSEIGYMLLSTYQGKGIISEAIKKVVKYGFEVMKLHSIEASIDPKNTASERVLQKNGFTKKAHLNDNKHDEDQFFDTVLYSILNPY